MIQFNLLPDVKLQYIKAKRFKRAAVIISSLVAVIVLSIFITLLLVVKFQKRHLDNLSRDIKSASSKLQGNPSLNRILTVQNQLISLPDLHNKKPVASRLFKYISDITPSNANITDLHVDFVENKMTIKGNADSISTINKFADTLKFTGYSNEDGSQQGKAFTNVVLDSFDQVQEKDNYEIKLNFDPAIFDSLNDKSLIVPKAITTRSEVEKPNSLFIKPPVDEEDQ